MSNPESSVKGAGAQVVFSVEKNRLGPTGVEMHYSFYGEHFVFETNGE